MFFYQTFVCIYKSKKRSPYRASFSVNRSYLSLYYTFFPLACLGNDRLGGSLFSASSQISRISCASSIILPALLDDYCLLNSGSLSILPFYYRLPACLYPSSSNHSGYPFYRRPTGQCGSARASGILPVRFFYLYP